MKIKRFFANDIRQALRQVKESLGPDAVILSNKSVDGGVELVAARDYDESAFAGQQSKSRVEPELRPLAGTAEVPAPAVHNDLRLQPTSPPSQQTRQQPAPSLRSETQRQQQATGSQSSRPRLAPVQVEWSQDPALLEMRREMKALRRMMENQLSELTWNEMGQRQPVKRELLRRLMALDIGPEICLRLAERVQDFANPDHAWRQALNQLAAELPIAQDNMIDEGGVIALVGPTGVGKTTTIAKLAARYVLRHGHRGLALVSTDSYRIGAQEQLNTYARILDVTIRSAATPEELKVTLNALSDKRLVLVDTAGMSQRDVRLSEQLALINSGNRMVKRYLTLSTTTQQSALVQAASAFGASEISGCILTKVDEATSLGGAISATLHSGIPLAFFTDGQKVPEDIHLARAHTLISRAVTLAQERTDELSDACLSLALGGVTNDVHG
ncbi:MAG: flagellar biosynthesis protein FlhF [Gammaproteobacteria bacterium]|nr:flagellar biosynthesis protein FlhF [Gammaproteobacteria bacterium]